MNIVSARDARIIVSGAQENKIEKTIKDLIWAFQVSCKDCYSIDYITEEEIGKCNEFLDYIFSEIEENAKKGERSLVVNPPRLHFYEQLYVNRYLHGLGYDVNYDVKKDCCGCYKVKW